MTDFRSLFLTAGWKYWPLPRDSAFVLTAVKLASTAMMKEEAKIIESLLNRDFVAAYKSGL